MAYAPNYQGVFLRGYGGRSFTQNNGSAIGNTATSHWSGAIGAIQGDGVRRNTGALGWFSLGLFRQGKTAGMFTNGPNAVESHVDGYVKTGYEIYTPYVNYDNIRQNPVANEIRPVNVAVRHLVRTR